MRQLSGKQMCLQVSPKLFGVNSWIVQMIRQLLVWRQEMQVWKVPQQTRDMSRNDVLISEWKTKWMNDETSDSVYTLDRWTHPAGAVCIQGRPRTFCTSAWSSTG